MEECSELWHTAIGNGLGRLFEPKALAGTHNVLTGQTGPEEFTKTRTGIERWAIIRRDVEANLMALSTEYTPYAAGLGVLRAFLPAETWESLSVEHGRRIRATLRIEEFVAAARSALSEFDQGIQAVKEGRMGVVELGRLHTRLLNAYRAR